MLPCRSFRLRLLFRLRLHQPGCLHLFSALLPSHIGFCSPPGLHFLPRLRLLLRLYPLFYAHISLYMHGSAHGQGCIRSPSHHLLLLPSGLFRYHLWLLHLQALLLFLLKMAKMPVNLFLNKIGKSRHLLGYTIYIIISTNNAITFVWIFHKEPPSIYIIISYRAWRPIHLSGFILKIHSFFCSTIYALYLGWFVGYLNV